ncbi:MAG: hypothetical protein ABSH51_09075 [Solirubrobacteraceae bacterium]|jgi:hypothetical protein
MSSRPTISLVDNPVAIAPTQVNEPEQAERTEPPATPTSKPRRAPRRSAPSSTRTPPPQPARPAAATNPYAGMRKVQVPVRLFPPLWDRLDEIVTELRAEHLDVDKTALLNAVMHLHGPDTTDSARELVDRWRALLASPPPRP